MSCYGGEMDQRSAFPTKTDTWAGSRVGCITMLAALALLSGCVQNGYPSLAVRPAERITLSATSVPSPTATPPAITALSGTALNIRLNALLRDARAAHAGFLAKREATAALVNAGKAAPVASEQWSVAQQAISRLGSARTSTTLALAEILRIRSDDRVAHAIADGSVGYADGAQSGARPDAAAINAARDEVTTMIAEEDAWLASLRGRLAN